jgi:hypothetical protein
MSKLVLRSRFNIFYLPSLSQRCLGTRKNKITQAIFTRLWKHIRFGQHCDWWEHRSFTKQDTNRLRIDTPHGTIQILFIIIIMKQALQTFFTMTSLNKFSTENISISLMHKCNRWYNRYVPFLWKICPNFPSIPPIFPNLLFHYR